LAEVERFDAIIIGTGQGGKPLAGDLAQAGWRTAIVERDRVGGTCVVRGCTPTKTMIASARVAHLARRAGDYGVRTGDVSVDLEVVRRRKRDIVDSWSAGSKRGMQRHETLELVEGTARFSGPRMVTVDLNAGGHRTLTADHVFINVGARNRVPDLPGLDTIDYLDSTSVMQLGQVPEHLIVLGGGFIGLEFAQMFRRFGARVTVVERQRLVAREDPDVSEAIEEMFREEGIEVLTEANALSVSGAGDGVELWVGTANGDLVIGGSQLMVAVGVVPNADTLDLETAGIEVNGRGQIVVNDRCETTAEGVWALGDVTGAPPFTHVSYDDYRIIRRNLLEGDDASRRGRILPYAMFTDPQLGRVGMSEREAASAGRSFRVAKLPMTRVARAVETDETRGFLKAVVDVDTDEILGAAVLGVEGGEVVTVLQMAMMGGLPWTALRDAVIAHPTFSESLNNLFMSLPDEPRGAS
jgi:pyruvate/2-oxoglutarate dehydrogenase complex dihydrolipoamide dehydrogenase (E3) component